ncbi:unnamed protein product, partial [Rotaria sp. Silwood2]
MRQKIVKTKEQNSNKTLYKAYQSEESFNQSIMKDLFKNANKRTEMNSAIEKYPIVLHKDGTDKSFTRATYSEVLHLYKLATGGQMMKAEDKDKYLPSKFLQLKEKWYLSNIIESLFVDRMIADIFLKISMKQRLHEKAVRVLLNGINSLENVEEKIFGNVSKRDKCLKAIIKSNKARYGKWFSGFFDRQYLLKYQNDSDLVSEMTRKIYNDCITNLEQLKTTIAFEVNKVRYAAIKAIYYSTMTHNGTLEKEQLKHIEQFQNDNDEEFKKYVIKIIAIHADNNNIDYKKLFKTCLEELEKNVNVEESVNFVYKQCLDNDRCEILFNEDIISRISSLLENNSLDEESKLHCCMTINKYLERSYTPGLNMSQLKNCIFLFNDQKDNSILKIQVLHSIFLTASKNYDIPEYIVETLIENIDKFTPEIAYFVTVTLEIVSQRQSIPNVNQLSFKLLDNWGINGESDTLFGRSLAENSDCPSISSTVAKIFVNTLSNRLINITNQTLEHLTQALDSNSHKQTRILSAKALYLAQTNHDIHENILIELQEYVNDEVPDVLVYSTVVYAKGLAKLSLTEKPIMESHFRLLPKNYVFEDLVLNEENFTGVVNKNVLDVLLNECKKTEFNDDIFSIFDRILSSESPNQDRVIQIIDHYTEMKYLLPQKTIYLLDSFMEFPQYTDQILKIFKKLIRNKQTV